VIARLGGVAVSVLFHGGLIALLLAWSASDWARPLFVDLGERAESPGAPSAEPAPARSPRLAARAARPAPAPAAAPAGREPVEPAAPSAPAPPPAPVPVEPAAPPAPAIAADPVPAPAPAPVSPAAPSLAPAASAPAEGRGGPADHAGGRSGGPTRGDTDRDSGGGAPGSPLALAVPGTGGAGAVPPEYGPYLQRFRQRVEESLIYPLAARRQGLGGTVELHVWLEASGRVRDVQVARSSSHGLLDEAAIATIRRLGPMPFPDSLPRRPLLIRLPLVYELR
jgi:protein TonB